MTQELRNKIIESLLRVKGESFAAFCIQEFAKKADENSPESAFVHVSDEDIIEMITGLQEQVKGKSMVLRRVLGKEFDFIMSIEFEGVLVCGK